MTLWGERRANPLSPGRVVPTFGHRSLRRSGLGTPLSRLDLTGSRASCPGVGVTGGSGGPGLSGLLKQVDGSSASVVAVVAAAVVVGGEPGVGFALELSD